MLLLFWDGASAVAEPAVVYPTPVARLTAVAISNREHRIATISSNRPSRIATAVSTRARRISTR